MCQQYKLLVYFHGTALPLPRRGQGEEGKLMLLNWYRECVVPCLNTVRSVKLVKETKAGDELVQVII